MFYNKENIFFIYKSIFILLYVFSCKLTWSNVGIIVQNQDITGPLIRFGEYVIRTPEESKETMYVKYRDDIKELIKPRSFIVFYTITEILKTRR